MIESVLQTGELMSKQRWTEVMNHHYSHSNSSLRTHTLVAYTFFMKTSH